MGSKWYTLSLFESKHIENRNKSESPRPRAVWVDPGRGPGEVSPDSGLTPGQAYEV